MNNIKTTITALALAGFSALATAQTFHLVVPISGNVKNLNNGNPGGATSPETPSSTPTIKIIEVDANSTATLEYNAAGTTFISATLTAGSCTLPLQDWEIETQAPIPYACTENDHGLIDGRAPIISIEVQTSGGTATDTFKMPSVDFLSTEKEPGVFEIRATADAGDMPLDKYEFDFNISITGADCSSIEGNLEGDGDVYIFNKSEIDLSCDWLTEYTFDVSSIYFNKTTLEGRSFGHRVTYTK